MLIRIAELKDLDLIKQYDKHIAEAALTNALTLGRIIIAEDNNDFIGWLRYNYFWDNTPFMNMLFILEPYRSCGYGKTMTAYWEKQMKMKGYDLVMTSSLSNEAAQHFYRKLNYVDAGALLLPDEPLEIIFVKKL